MESESNEVGASSSASPSTKAKTAGIIIIGDEVLKGQVMDINSNYLCKELYSLGIKLARISVIPDTLDDISEEVRQFSKKYDFVFTTGGIGPTHDDITYVGVGEAFGEPIVINHHMVTMWEKWLGHKGYSKDAILKMAEMPQSALLMFDPVTPYSFPIVIVRNVYIFPGIPQYVLRMFPRIRHLLGTHSHFYAKVIYVDRGELEITENLNLAVEKFKGRVTFGSYPIIDNLYFSTKLTMDSEVEEDVLAAHLFLSNALPEGSCVEYDSQPLLSATEKIYAIVQDSEHPLHKPVKISVTKLEEAVDQYGLGGLCLCFNGGKDCTALLHLFHAVVGKKVPGNEAKLSSLSINYENPFPEMENFLRETTERYNLNVWSYDAPIQAGLTETVSEHPEVRAVLMGTRRSDPSGQNLDYFHMTDSSWPQVMRVSPMLDWTYTEVWKFLRMLTLPYCSLYNQGYTSIGSQSNTVPNEALKYIDPSGEGHYRPAYTLHDSSSERSGRQ